MLIKTLLDILDMYKDIKYRITVTGKIRINGRLYYFDSIEVKDVHRYDDMIELEVEDIKL